MTDSDKLAELKKDQESLQVEVREAGALNDQSRVNAALTKIIAVNQEILDLEHGEKNYGKTHDRSIKDPTA
ncbi:hypothetical protein FV226_21760 [Methylobacterium sp. WL12]|uniref:hypothetical protein n=1 Tax=Methylobacterium sp. WL12 TaxID=2603890 RepID=UPI0011C97061|nr:hypothetical protein [Methylobacterium sp. WL12]TXM67461.1 hypothetical protein FV226_21760 [Methylobacterium sp. WL12]